MKMWMCLTAELSGFFDEDRDGDCPRPCPRWCLLDCLLIIIWHLYQLIRLALEKMDRVDD